MHTHQLSFCWNCSQSQSHEGSQASRDGSSQSRDPRPVLGEPKVEDATSAGENPVPVVGAPVPLPLEANASRSPAGATVTFLGAVGGLGALALLGYLFKDQVSSIQWIDWRMHQGRAPGHVWRGAGPPCSRELPCVPTLLPPRCIAQCDIRTSHTPRAGCAS